MIRKIKITGWLCCLIILPCSVKFTNIPLNDFFWDYSFIQFNSVFPTNFSNTVFLRLLLEHMAFENKLLCHQLFFKKVANIFWLPKISTSLSIWFTLFIRLSSWGCWSASFASRWSLCPYIFEAVSVIIGVGIRIDGGVAGILIKLKFGDFFNISFGGVLIWAWMPVFFFWYFLMFGWLCTTVITEGSLELLTRPLFAKSVRKRKDTTTIQLCPPRVSARSSRLFTYINDLYNSVKVCQGLSFCRWYKYNTTWYFPWNITQIDQ